MDYSVRTYRAAQGSNRCSFAVSCSTSDLWIAVDRHSYSEQMPRFAFETIRALRSQMEHYLDSDSAYLRSLVPCDPHEGACPVFDRMSRVSHVTGVGPMAGVAGACAEYVAEALTDRFACSEVVVENGGDIYARFAEPFDVRLFAGGSPLSDKIGVRLPVDLSPAGICTSSGTVGPSLSFGCADAVMIVCGDVVLADSYATAFANSVRSIDDVERVADLIADCNDVVAAMVVKDDRIGIVGSLETLYY